MFLTPTGRDIGWIGGKAMTRARKTVHVLVDDHGFKRLIFLLEKDHDIKGVMELSGLISRDDKYKVELEINGMLTVPIWNRFCQEVGVRIAYPD